MKNYLLLVAASLICLFNFASCNSGANTDQNKEQDTISTSLQQTTLTDYSGIYKTQANNPCQLSITITRENDGFGYHFFYDNQNYTGKLIIKEQDDHIYFSFDGKINDNEPKSVEGQFMDGKIMIQNYGNVMNNFKLFKTCDEKYLEFIKL